MSKPHGTVHWSELMTRDVAGAKAFYTALCGWEFEVMPMEDGEYHLAMQDGVPVAGIMDMTGMPGMDEVPPNWGTYLAVADVDAAVEMARGSGGAVLQEPFDVPDTGRIAMLSDPTGAAIGIMTPIEMG